MLTGGLVVISLALLCTGRYLDAEGPSVERSTNRVLKYLAERCEVIPALCQVVIKRHIYK